MSYGFVVYAADIDHLRRLCGSKDEALARTIVKRFGRKVEQLDKLFSDLSEDGGPSATQALQHLIDGAPFTLHAGSLYYYAFELLCNHIGVALDNSALYPSSWEFAGEVDQALEAMGVPEEVFHLSGFLTTRLPVALPLPGEFPLTGFIEAEQVLRAKAVFSRCSYGGSDASIRRALACIQGWLQEAAAPLVASKPASPRGLVSFYF